MYIRGLRGNYPKMSISIYTILHLSKLFSGILNMILESSSYTQNYDCILQYQLVWNKDDEIHSKLFHKHVERHVLLLWELLLKPSYVKMP